MPVTYGNIAFQVLSLAVLGAYCVMIYRFGGQAVRCVVNIATFSAPRTLHGGFVACATTLGALSVGLGTVKVAARLIADGSGTPGTVAWRLAGLTGTVGVEGLPSWVAVVAAVAVGAVAVCVVSIQVGMLRAVGGVTLSGGFVGYIVRMKQNWLAALSLALVPLVAVWTGVNPVRDTAASYLLGFVFVALAALFVAHTLRGFIKQKVSLLVWFLYLCTVEIFPVWALVLAAAKNV